MATASADVPSASTSSKPKLFQTPNGESIFPGTLILAPYRKGPKWPAVIRKLPPVPQKKGKFSINYLPIYSGDQPFKFTWSQLTIYKPEMESPDDPPSGLVEAYEMARDFHGKEVEIALQHCLDPPPRPEPNTEEKAKRPRKKKSADKSNAEEYVNTDDEIHSDDDADTRLGQEMISGNEDELTDESDEDVAIQQDIPTSKRPRRNLCPNEVVFYRAKETQFQSKDQVALIRNPNGPGLWPAQPVVVSEEKGFAHFVVFPRLQHKNRTRQIGQTSDVIRTCDTRMFELDEQRLDAMIVYVKERDDRLLQALNEVRAYLISNHRFDQTLQVLDPSFKEIEVSVELSNVEGENATTLSLDELTLSTNTGDKITTKNHESLIHKIPRRRAQEVQTIRENYATAREFGDSKPIWLIRHRVYTPHCELKHEQLVNEAVKDHFMAIWKGDTICTIHQLFLKCIVTQKTWFPSSYRINACTGGIVSNVTIDSAMQEFLKWIELGWNLPRMSTVDKFRYAMEIMLHEACVFVLCKEFTWTLEKAKTFLRDGQDYTFGLERGHRLQEIRDRLYPKNNGNFPDSEVKCEPSN